MVLDTAIRKDDPPGRSCRKLTDCETEFGAQGPELEGVYSAGAAIIDRPGAGQMVLRGGTE